MDQKHGLYHGNGFKCDSGLGHDHGSHHSYHFGHFHEFLPRQMLSAMTMVLSMTIVLVSTNTSGVQICYHGGQEPLGICDRSSARQKYNHKNGSVIIRRIMGIEEDHHLQKNQQEMGALAEETQFSSAL